MAIVGQLKIRLLPEEEKVLGQAPTDNVEAYTLYLKGRQFFHYSTKWFLGLARQMFTKAIELDPSFARAHAGLANCYGRLVGWYDESIAEEQILASAGRALALDPDLAEAHAAKADTLSILGHRDEAEEEFSQALVLDPNSFDTNLFYARHCMKGNALERSVELFIRALEVNPEDCQAALLIPPILRTLGRIEEAEKYSRLGLKRAEEALRLYPERSRPAQLGAATLAALGEAEEAKAWLGRALAIDPDDNSALYNAACTWAQLGDKDRAFDFLDKWSRHAGQERREWLRHDADLDPIRGDPRYPKLLEILDESPALYEVPGAKA